MKPEIHDILTNQEVISVDQDLLGREGRRVHKEGDLEIWARPLAGGDRAAVLLNRGEREQQITLNWEDLDYPNQVSATVRDLWQHKDLGKFTGTGAAVEFINRFLGKILPSGDVDGFEPALAPPPPSSAWGHPHLFQPSGEADPPPRAAAPYAKKKTCILA